MSQEDNDKDTLEIITEQINYLKAHRKELAYEDVRKLSELVKMRNLILGMPDQISEIVSDSKYSDFQVLTTLYRNQKKQAEVRGAKPKRKKKDS